MKLWPTLIGAVALGTLATIGCDDSTSPDTVTYTANLTAANEIPSPTGSPTATGTATLRLDEDDNELEVTIVISGNLTSNLTMAHIHGPASTTATAGIVLDFVPAMTTVIGAGTRTGTILNAEYDLDELTVSSTGVLRVSPATLREMLENGTAYVNVHTVTNGSGEIRGQVTRQ